MIVTVSSQRPIPLGGITGDGTHIFDPLLAAIDNLLNDEEFVLIVRRAIARHSKDSASRGAPRTACNRVLRLLALKHVKNWSLRELHAELQRNLDYRAFTQFFDQRIPNFSTFSRNFAFVDEQCVADLNAHLRRRAVEANLIAGKSMRLDTTVSETNIHYPTDSTLMRDGVRVLQRVIGRAEEILPALGRLRDRSRATLHRVLEINRAARGRGEAAQKQLVRSYRSLMETTRRVVSHANRVAQKLGDGRVTRGLSHIDQVLAQAAKAELETFVPRVDRVIRQARARICRGQTRHPDKLLSLFETDTCAIGKGKAHKPTEFGRVVEIEEVEHGFVSDYVVHDGAPADATLLLPAIERHKQNFGCAPRNLAGDRGFFSARNEREAKALGVKRVSIPARGKLSAVRRALQRTRWFRSLQRWRANGEGRIGILKNQYGLDRCLYKGDRGTKRWVGCSIFANNLVVTARRMQLNQKAANNRGNSQSEQGSSKAA